MIHEVLDLFEFKKVFNTTGNTAYYIVPKELFKEYPVIGDQLHVGSTDMEFYLIVGVSDIYQIEWHKGDIGLKLKKYRTNAELKQASKDFI